MVDSIRRSLPPVYEPLLGDFFDRPKVVETRATCSNCAMCDQGQSWPVAMDYFRPDTKCCTFWPDLPNFLVGAILSDIRPDIEEGRRRLQTNIARQIGVGAYFLRRPRKLGVIMLSAAEAFGRAPSLRCPYFDESNSEASCTIWRHREAVCHVYHCKYSGGVRGYGYWGALKAYLLHVQHELAVAAARAVDPRVKEPPRKKESMTVEDVEGLPPKATDYQAWWGEWVGQEEAFYRRCYEWVTTLDRDAFVQAIDEKPEAKDLLDAVRAKYEALERKILPKSLVRNARMKEQRAGDKVVVTSYHGYDWFMLEQRLYDFLGVLRPDQTLEENLDRLRREKGGALTPELIEYLFVAGVLVEPPNP